MMKKLWAYDAGTKILFIRKEVVGPVVIVIDDNDYLLDHAAEVTDAFYDSDGDMNVILEFVSLDSDNDCPLPRIQPLNDDVSLEVLRTMKSCKEIQCGSLTTDIGGKCWKHRFP